MLSRSAICILLSVIVPSYTQVVLTGPGPGEKFTTGKECVVQWNPDTTGTWKNVTLELMSGSNLVMNVVTTVASGLDCTHSNSKSFNWTCPDVTPNSGIYFYQLSQDSQKGWTSRFTIAAADGKTTSPPTALQPNGDPIPWGVGRLRNPRGDTNVTDSNHSRLLNVTMEEGSRNHTSNTTAHMPGSMTRLHWHNISATSSLPIHTSTLNISASPTSNFEVSRETNGDINTNNSTLADSSPFLNNAEGTKRISHIALAVSLAVSALSM